MNAYAGFLQHDALKGYLGYWYYIAAYCAYNLYNQGDATYKQKYIEYLKKASSTTLSIKWFNKLIDENEQDNDDKYISCVLERMEAVIANNKI